MYVTGVIFSSKSRTFDNSLYDLSTLAKLAISAIEQPADKSGRMVIWLSLDKISATSAIKCTPRKTIYLASSF